MRLLVTGGSSYLGRRFIAVGHEGVQRSHEIHYTYFQNNPFVSSNGHQLDLREQTAVSRLITQIKPDVILHFAGSNRPDDMAAVIRKGTQYVVESANRVGTRLIHLSTDSIFDGQNAPYDETAVANPVNEYGRAKADAEAFVMKHSNHVIVRTSLIYDLQEMDHGTRWMAQALQEGKPITLFANQIRNPVWLNTLVDACFELIDHDFCGILNIAGKQHLTRAAFAVRMLNYWQIGNRKLVTIKNSPKEKWPLDCRLNLQLAERSLTTPLLTVDELVG